MKTWEEFCRFQGSDTFYGCVDPDGIWFDSSESFKTAIHWCCYEAGEFDISPEKEVNWMVSEGLKRGYSIIHSTLLRRMYESGLIK